MSEAHADLLEVRREDHLLILSMRREKKRNSIDRKLADALSEALDRLDDDDDLWAGVLTGTPRIFSAGSDLTSGGDYVTERGGEYGLIRRTRRKPLIAAVEGMALGGGFEIVLACDLVVAARNAHFGLPEVSIGVLPTCSALFRGPNALPLNLAREMILTGEPIDAERAHAAGFVNRLSEPGEALEGAIALARRILENAPLSVQASLRSVNEYVGREDGLGWRLTSRAFEEIKHSDDVREGVKSFLEKRSPKWQGC